MATPRKRKRTADPTEPCPKCGQLHERQGHVTCSGHRKAAYGGGPCLKFPVAGSTVCRTHGAAAPQTKAKAEERVAIEAARRACDRLGVPLPPEEGDPGTILIGLVREWAGNVEFYRTLVGELPTHPEPPTFERGDDGKLHFVPGDPGVYGPTYHQSGIPTGEAKPHVLVVLYAEACDRLARYCKEALAAGIEERRIRLEEADARTLMAGFTRAVNAAQLTPEQTEVLRRVFADHIRQSSAAGEVR